MKARLPICRSFADDAREDSITDGGRIFGSNGLSHLPIPCAGVPPQVFART
jgi:hypothetical protein